MNESDNFGTRCPECGWSQTKNIDDCSFDNLIMYYEHRECTECGHKFWVEYFLLTERIVDTEIVNGLRRRYGNVFPDSIAGYWLE
jgi:transcriptional regulator NrdR family protein